MSDQTIEEYVREQLIKGVEREVLASNLLQSGYTRVQVDQLLPLMENKQKKQPNVLLWLGLVVVLLAVLSVGVWGYGEWWGQSEKGVTTEVVDTTEAVVEPSRSESVGGDQVGEVSEQTSLEEMSDECKPYYDVGYLKGLNGRPIDFQSDVVSVPDICSEWHMRGFLEGKKERGQQLTDYNDMVRKADLYSISNAVFIFASVNDGELPEGLTSEEQVLGTAPGNLDIIDELKPYLELTYEEEREFAWDPVGGSVEDTKYTIRLNENGRVEMQAESEMHPGEKIEVIR